jgi:molybdopterin-guanine dinucleotide biosynthesis protein A
MLAGGQSRRFGRSKVFEPIAGAPLPSWGVGVLQEAGLAVGVVSDAMGLETVLGVPTRPDLEPGLGPIGGLWTALQWARDRGDHGVLLLGCDMPLVNEALVRMVLGGPAAAPAVVPLGSAGLEPLCALYRLDCMAEVERRLHSPDRSLHGLTEAVGAAFIEADVVASVVDLGTVFLNVNTVSDRDRAEGLLKERTPRASSRP